MSKTVVNKREQFKWDNGFDPNGKSIPDITESDEGKFIKVVDGVLAFGEGGGGGGITYTAGDNIQISDSNVISATDTTYTAGTNITIDSNNQISATDTTYSAGTGITITGTSISADSQLPSYSSSESGKVLSVDSNGDLEWSTPSGGGGSETWTVIATNINASWNWGDYRTIIGNYEGTCPTKSVWDSYKKIAIEFIADDQWLGYHQPNQNWLRENDNGSTEYNTPKFLFGIKSPSGNWRFETIGISGLDTQSNKYGSCSVSCYFEPNTSDDDQTNPRWGLTVRFSHFVYNDNTTNNSLGSVKGIVNVYGIKY